jgi:hypothetical protein|uniref:thiol oxidase n=1 Tax=viral metagenome TaxID=1070528 RepID=A0A6C0DN64_9ZZZZ
MPSPEVWGPVLWTILHSIAYTQEKQKTLLLQDAHYQYVWMIEHLETCIPCEECRQHTIEYRKKHPYRGVSPIRWIWEFHNAVNERLGKESVSFESMEHRTVSSIRDAWKNYTKTIQESLSTGRLRGDLLKEFTRHFKLWASFIGV